MTTFNIIISGVGGQGLITLLQVIAQAALDKGYDVKTSELHGLSQRGGSVSVHIRFGKKVFSPMVPQNKADLLLGLELHEALNVAQFASGKSVFLVNQYQTPTLCNGISESQIKKNIKRVAKKIFFIPASDICKKKLGADVVAGVFLLGYAVSKGVLPLKESDIKKAMRQIMPKKYWDINFKALELAKSYEPKS